MVFEMADVLGDVCGDAFQGVPTGRPWGETFALSWSKSLLDCLEGVAWVMFFGGLSLRVSLRISLRLRVSSVMSSRMARGVLARRTSWRGFVWGVCRVDFLPDVFGVRLWMPLRIVNGGVAGRIYTGSSFSGLSLRVSRGMSRKILLGGVSENVSWGSVVVFGGRRCVVSFRAGLGDVLEVLSLNMSLEHVFEHTFWACLPQFFQEYRGHSLSGFG